MIGLLLLSMVPIPATAQAERSLTLQEVIRMALENNLDLQVSRFNPEISATDIERQKAQFDASLDSVVQTSHEEQPAFIDGQTVNREFTFESVTYNDRLMYGLEYGVTALAFRSDGVFIGDVGPPLVFTSFGPVFHSELNLNFKQPLIRNRGTQVNRTQIRVSRNNKSISDAQFQQKVLDTLKTVEDSYWELVFAIRDLQVRRKSLERARQFLEENKVKVEVGTLAPIEITTAEAEVASRMEDVIVGENAHRDAEDNLRVQISSMENPMWEEQLRPVDRPPFVKAEVNLEQSIQQAMESRPDLMEQQFRIDNEEINLRFQRNQRKYGLDLEGNYYVRGEINRGFPIQMNDDHTDAWQQVTDLDFTSWDVQLNLNIPLSNREAKSQYAATRLRKEQALVNYEYLKQRATQEVRRAARQIETDSQRVEAAQVNVRLQREKLEAEEKKYENGMSTSFQVLEFQEDVAEAERSHARALIDYNVSLVELDRVTGTLASNRGIVVE